MECCVYFLAGDEHTAIESVTDFQPIPCQVLSRMKSHYFKCMRLAEQPAVFSVLTLDPQQIQVKGFSQDAIQANCQYLSLPIWFPVPKGALVRCSRLWLEIVCDFVSRFGTVPVPTLVSEQQSLGWHGRRFARCIISILKHNNVTIFTYLGLPLELSIPFTFKLNAPNHKVFLPSCSRLASILNGMHLANE